MLRVGLSLALLLCAVACGHEPTTTAPTPASAGPVAPLEFTATLELAHDSRGKQFHGVLLRGDDGETWVVSYQPEPWLRPFADQHVRVTGERYTPGGQALVLPHLRLHTLALVDPGRSDDAAFESIGPERTLHGTFTDEVGSPGSKLAGDPYRVFKTADGRTYLLANDPVDVLPGQPQQIVAREVVLSSHVARRGGPALYVMAIQR